MPRYVTAVHTAWRAEEAFGFMADVCNFGRWDPGVHSVTAVHGDGPGLGSAARKPVSPTKGAAGRAAQPRRSGDRPLPAGEIDACTIDKTVHHYHRDAGEAIIAESACCSI